MEHRRHEPTTITAAAEEEEFSLREWAVKARMVSRVNTGSRRFSASFVTTSFREDALTATKSFRSNITATNVSSTASSPGYTFRGEIDPSTYSFTTAIKALQARSSGYNWDCLSPDQGGGCTLHSKWNEAEKYICNPLSGQIPLECLSAKTLLSSGRSFRHNIPGAGRVTMSAPLVYHPSQSRLINVLPTKPCDLSKPIIDSHVIQKDHNTSTPLQEKQRGTVTRDVGIQSTPPELSWSTSTSIGPSTPPIEERSITKRETEEHDSPSSNNTENTKLVDKEDKREREEEEETKREEMDIDDDHEKKANKICMCKQGGCCLLSWKRLWMRNRQMRDKQKARNNKNISIPHTHIN